VDILEVQSVNSPAGVYFTHDELLIIWAYLTRIPTTENGEIRRKIERYLEHRDAISQRDMSR
jgi:hypothetical protein